MTLANRYGLSRRELILALLRALVNAVGLVVLYYVVPWQPDPRTSAFWQVTIGIGIFIAVLSFQLRAVLKSEYPMKRAAISMATLFPLFLVIFAWIDLSMSISDPSSFNELLNRTDSLYFTITTMATVGYGDIHAVTETARAVIMVQMVGNIVLIVGVFRLIIGLASRQASIKRGIDLKAGS